MRLLPYIMLLLLYPLAASAQKENHIWMFGGFMQFNFNTGSPTWTTSPMSAMEGCATVSDKNGNLLFFTNGYQVWNRNGVIMPNGSGLKGNFSKSTTQGAVVVPFISNPNKYYLFTQEALGESKQYLYYHVIDMTLNGGLGDIVPSQKDIVLDSNMSEKMFAVKGDGCYSWLMTHRSDREFRAYKIDINGLNTVPVSSLSGLLPGNDYSTGEMKASPDRKMIVLGNVAAPIVELHDFDIKTGVVSNAVKIDTVSTAIIGAGAYGIEFSHDSKYLFTTVMTNAPFTNNLACTAHNLSGGSVKQTFTVANSTFGGMRLGPDKKVYIAASNKVHYFGILGSIPWIIFASLGPAPPSTHYGMAFGNDVPILFDTSSFKISDTSYCIGNTLQLEAPESYNAYLWSTGATTPTVNISAAGKYWLKLESDVCGSYTDTFEVVSGDVLIPDFTIADKGICPDETLPVVPAQGYPNYLWNTGSHHDTLFATAPGTYWLEISNDCGMSKSDTFLINDKNIPVPAFNITDTSLCPGEKYSVTTPSGFLQYLWSTGSTQQGATLSKTGHYWVSVKNACNIGHTDSFSIYPPRSVQFDIADTIVCINDAFTIHGPEGYPKYLWSTTDTSPFIDPPAAGKYWLELQNRCGDRHTDSFLINDMTTLVTRPALGNDTFNCEYDLLVPVTLTTPYPGGNSASLIWNDGSTTNSLAAEQPGTYWVQVSNQCVNYNDTIELKGCPPKEIDSIWLPRAFSPNGDGKNDVFRIPYPKFQIVSVELRIFNRFGENVYNITNVKDGWDGQDADLGVYYYYLKYKDNAGKEHLQKGDVTLLR